MRFIHQTLPAPTLISIRRLSHRSLAQGDRALPDRAHPRRSSYGCGTALDGTPLSSLGNFGALAGYDLGVGYVAAPALRLEAVVQHHPHAAFEGRANFVQTAGMQAVSADWLTFAGGRP